MELLNKLEIDDIKPNTLSLKLNVNAGRLYTEHFIKYVNKRSYGVRRIELKYDFDHPIIKFKERTRIAHYSGLPELMSMFKQIGNIRTSDTLRLNVPKCEYKVVNVETTEFQKELVAELSDRADAINSGNVDPSFEDNPDTKLNQCVENVVRIQKNLTMQKKKTTVNHLPKGNRLRRSAILTYTMT